MKRQNWTKSKIKLAFDRYIHDHNRLPTALEVDQTTYLPSSRFIQSKFGGLKKLRAELGYKENNFGSGINRSKIALRVSNRGRQAEINLEDSLVNIFGEIFVHTEKIFNDRKTRVDFFVYTPTGNFGVDIFHPDNVRTMQSNLNIKFQKYRNFPVKLFYVVANQDISQETLNQYLNNRKQKLPPNQRLMTLKRFLDTIKDISTYPNPLEKNGNE